MKKISLFLKSFLFLSLTLLLWSCADALRPGKTELSLTLPFGQANSNNARAAEDENAEYTFEISFTHESGEEKKLTGKSGETIVLSPAKEGQYTINGQAFNKENKLCYEGSCTAIAVSGLSTDVELTMKAVVKETEPAKPEEEKPENPEEKEEPAEEEIISEADHIKLESDEKGVKITIQALESDVEWTWDNTYILEEESGNNVCINQLLSPGKSAVYYYPFTEKDKIYHFTFEVTTKGKGHITEKVNVKAGGGDASYFTYNSDYDDAEIILNDGKNGNLKLTKDYMSIFDISKKFSILRYYIDNYGNDSNDKTAGWGKWINPIKINYEDREAFVSSGINIWDVDSSIASELSQYKYWMTYVTIEFAIPEFPDQIFRANNKLSEFYEFEKPEEFRENKHIKAEPCSDGIKITLKWQEGDVDWESWYEVREDFSKAGISLYFTDNPENAISKENPEYEFVYPLTKKDKIYTFYFASSATGEYKVEKVWCKAGGGVGEIIDFEKWNSYKPVIDNEKESWHFEGDVTKIISPLDLLKLESLGVGVQLFGGKEDFSDFEFITSNYYSNQEGYNNLSELNEEATFSDYNPYLQAKLSSWKTYFIQAYLSFKLKNYPLTYSTVGLKCQAENLHYDETIKFLEQSEDLDYNWASYYACYQSDYEKTTFNPINENNCEFTLESDFDNDTFEMQFQKKFPILESDRSVNVQFDFTSSVDVDSFEYDVFLLDHYGLDFKNFNYQEIEAKANTPVHVDYSFELRGDMGVAALCFIPFKAGSYKIENIQITPSEEELSFENNEENSETESTTTETSEEESDSSENTSSNP